jgi:hypothetical protein
MTITSRIRSLGRSSLVASVLLLPLAARAQVTPTPSEPPPPVVVEPAPAQPVVVATPPAEPAKPAPPPPEPVTTSNKGKLTVKGFVNATFFAQDAQFTFGDGQNAEFPNPVRALGDDPWFIDGDVRNTRVNLTWEGPTGANIPKLGAQVEIDFFSAAGQGAASTLGGFGNAQAIPRIRLAHADIALGPGTFKLGQAWSPWFGLVPVSTSRFAFPLGYGSAGGGGWRFIGLWYVMPLTPKDAALGATLTIAVMRNVWPGAANLNPPNQGSAGVPQLEGRIDLTGKAGKNAWNAYVTGHFDQKDLDGRGDAMGSESLTGWGVKGGAKIQAGPLMVQAEGHVGRAMGHQFSAITQFGDIGSWGAWGQVGFDATPNFGIFAFFGIEDPNDDDLPTMFGEGAAAARLRNIQMAGLVRYKVGAYQLGLEYIRDTLDFRDGMGETDVTGQQIALSAFYGF